MSAPACLQVPPGVLGSYVDEVGEIMEMVGRPLDPHQLTAVEALTSYGRGGRWPSFVAGVEGPRQTVGKTGGILLPIALTLCLTFVADERTWTAHRLDTTEKTFKDARQLLGVDDNDRLNWSGPLARRVKSVGLENGNEHLEFANGSFLWFKARSERAGRGLSGHDVFADELLYADDGQFGALVPTMATRSAQGSPRLWTGSSSGKAQSAFLRRLRRRAVSGDPGVAYVGWWARGSWADPPCALGTRCTHVLGTEGCALDDPALRHEANPGLGVRTSMAFLDEARGLMSPLEFGREFLGWEEAGDDDGPDALPLESWAACADPQSAIVGAPVLALDVALDRSWACIAAAGYREDGLPTVEVAAYEPGTAWIAERLGRMNREQSPLAVGLDPKGPAGNLIEAIEDQGVSVETLDLADQVTGCGDLVDAVTEGTMRHRGDQLLLTAIRAAARRNVGDAFAWTRRKSTGDICPLVAFTEALLLVKRYGVKPSGDAGGVWWV